MRISLEVDLHCDREKGQPFFYMHMRTLLHTIVSSRVYVSTIQCIDACRSMVDLCSDMVLTLHSSEFRFRTMVKVRRKALDCLLTEDAHFCPFSSGLYVSETPDWRDAENPILVLVLKC